MKKIYTLFLALIISSSIFSQGQSPNNIKWMEINSKHAQFIFPEEITDQAQKAANLLDYLYSFETKSLNTSPKKLPVILYNQSTISNGFAALRPRRSAWFSTPSQYASDLGTVDWYYTLGSHEFRHIVQYSKNNKHFTKFMSTVFGQTGLLMGQYSIPYWFYEGDAVCTETALSDGGRGRIPQFDMPIRTILLNDINISYDKAKFGSYKTFYPSYYNLGYLLCSKARVLYGYDIWDKTLTHTSKISFWPYAFSRGLKKTTGLNEKKLYEKVMKELKSDWSKEIENVKYTGATIINNEEKNSWTKYTEVNYLDENTFLAKKSSLKSDITTLYLIDRNGKETKLKATDAGIISTAGNKVVWSRKYPDPRWQVRNYSDIIVFDIKTKKEIRLTKKQKFLVPSISNDGKKIVAVEYNPKMQTKLVFIDSETGKRYKEVNSPNNEYIRTPSWNEDGNKIVFTRTNKKGTALSILDINTDIIYDLTDHSSENIGRPVFYKNYILYNSPYNGTGNIYAIDIDTKKRYQITSRKFGAYNPKVRGNKLVFIDYTEKGYDIAEIEFDESNLKSLEESDKYRFKTVEILQEQEQGKNILHPDLIPNKTFTVKKYNKLKHAVNIHSWGFTTDYPSEYDIESLQAFSPEIGLNIYSANMMNTVFGVANAAYNINEETYSSGLSAIFKKYYPVLSVKGNWAQRSINISDTEVDEWTELKGKFEFSVPLDFSRGIYYKGLNLKSAYSHIKTEGRYIRQYIDETGNGNFSSLSYSGSAYNFRKQANQDINPKFGQFVYLIYQHTPFNEDINGHQLSAFTSLYFPGIIKHHSINIKAGYEKQREGPATADYYWFGSPQSFPRGYDYAAFDQFYSFNFNYSFPIWYPDINIGPFVYFKRLRANLFYDFAETDEINSNNKISFQSAGAELFLQVYVLRLGEPIEIGGRVSYLFNADEGEPYIIPEFLVLGIPF
ncbi:MAG: hypothetical protein K8R54_11985 [Bacteroidales bacterium]|nr:hypothetical protein [Bacteroidales bacterium]